MQKPQTVKFIGYKSKNPLYETGFRRNKIYRCDWDDHGVDEVYFEYETVTVKDDNDDLHEIDKGDYEVKTWEEDE